MLTVPYYLVCSLHQSFLQLYNCVQFFRSTHFLMHYLDDFLFIGTTGSLDAARTMDKASAVVRDLGGSGVCTQVRRRTCLCCVIPSACSGYLGCPAKAA